MHVILRSINNHAIVDAFTAISLIKFVRFRKNNFTAALSQVQRLQ